MLNVITAGYTPLYTNYRYPGKKAVNYGLTPPVAEQVSFSGGRAGAP